MRATTVGDVGAVVRTVRQRAGLTQAELARRLGVSRDWVVRLEQGHPRLEAQKVFDALAVLGLMVDLRLVENRTADPSVRDHDSDATLSEQSSPTPDDDASAAGSDPPLDPFSFLFEDN